MLPVQTIPSSMSGGPAFDQHFFLSFFFSSCVFNLQKSYEEMFLSGKTKQNNQTKQIQNNVDCLRSEIDRNTQKVNKNAEFNCITRID